jgi:hypothetical protein
MRCAGPSQLVYVGVQPKRKPNDREVRAMRAAREQSLALAERGTTCQECSLLVERQNAADQVTGPPQCSQPGQAGPTPAFAGSGTSRIASCGTDSTMTAPPHPRPLDPLLIALARARVAVIAIQEGLDSDDSASRSTRAELAIENLRLAAEALRRV